MEKKGERNKQHRYNVERGKKGLGGGLGSTAYCRGLREEGFICGGGLTKVQGEKSTFNIMGK